MSATKQRDRAAELARLEGELVAKALTVGAAFRHGHDLTAKSKIGRELAALSEQWERLAYEARAER